MWVVNNLRVRERLNQQRDNGKRLDVPGDAIEPADLRLMPPGALRRVAELSVAASGIDVHDALH